MTKNEQQAVEALNELFGAINNLQQGRSAKDSSKPDGDSSQSEPEEGINPTDKSLFNESIDYPYGSTQEDAYSIGFRDGVTSITGGEIDVDELNRDVIESIKLRIVTNNNLVPADVLNLSHALSVAIHAIRDE